MTSINNDSASPSPSVLSVNETNFKTEVLDVVDKLVLVDFYADWCGPCKQLSPVIEELSIEMSEVKFVKVNVDENQVLSQENAVSSIPSVKIFKKGKVVKDFVGFMPKQKIQDLLKKCLINSSV